MACFAFVVIVVGCCYVIEKWAGKFAHATAEAACPATRSRKSYYVGCIDGGCLSLRCGVIECLHTNSVLWGGVLGPPRRGEVFLSLERGVPSQRKRRPPGLASVSAAATCGLSDLALFSSRCGSLPRLR